jgi:hypothetical protein
VEFVHVALHSPGLREALVTDSTFIRSLSSMGTLMCPHVAHARKPPPTSRTKKRLRPTVLHHVLIQLVGVHEFLPTYSAKVAIGSCLRCVELLYVCH